MDINCLREFVILVQTGNFQEAADHLYISQSALSKHIQKMEKDLGATLFIRTTRKVELSNYGRILYPYASKIVQLENDYTSALIENMEAEKQQLSIGSIPTLAHYGITDLLVKFRQDNPSIKLNVIQTGTKEQRELLRTGKIELAFIRELEQRKGEFASTAYAKDFLVAVLPVSHPLADHELIDLRDLAEEEFILLKEGTMVHEMAVSACEQCGFTPRITYTDHKIENLVDLIQKGMGVGLLMDQLAYHHHNPQLKIVNVTPSPSSYINLCYRKDQELSIAARHFLQCIEQY